MVKKLLGICVGVALSCSLVLGVIPQIRYPFYVDLGDLRDVAATATDSPTDNYVLTYDSATGLWGPEAAAGGGTDVKVGVDAAATAGYFGIDGTDGIFRFTANHFTMADGGNYVTLSLADHATARAALGLEIGADVNAYDADLTTYAGITPSANVQSILGAADYAAIAALQEASIETAIDTLANLTSVQGQTLTLAGSFVTQNNNVTINAVTAARTLTLNESLTIGDGYDGTLTFSGSGKTLTVEDTSVVNQDLSSDANVTFGSVTAGAGTPAINVYDGDLSNYTAITQAAIAV